MAANPQLRAENRAKRWCRLTAVCTAVLFAFGITRFYMIIPLDKFLCLEATRGRSEAILSSHSHRHDHDHDHGPAARTSSEDGGFVITHCKDEVNGFALTPIQPLGAPEVPGFFVASVASFGAGPQNSPLVDAFVDSPFQPPRA